MAAADIYDISINECKHPFLDYLAGRFPAGGALPDPTLIIGAGHQTHWPMLAARRARGGKAVVMMRPSLPLRMFDFCLIPAHDNVPERGHVITTCGALNEIQYREDKNDNLGLILIGGRSSHFVWDEKSVSEQIQTIIKRHNKLDWYLADSPRTPNNFINTISLPKTVNYAVLHYTDTPPAVLHDYLMKASIIWVTEDSVSMLYEALTAGAKTALIELNKTGTNRLTNGILALIEKGYITTYNQWLKDNGYIASPPHLDEATRCAKYLINNI